MKITVIFGSPRKKNSWLLTRAFEEEMKKLCDAEFEYVFLSDLSLATCVGCHACLFHGVDKCPLPDSIRDTLEAMVLADGIVFVSPVYVSQVTGLMKNFIDRFSFLCHRPGLHGQHGMVISTTGVMGLKGVLKYMGDVAASWGIRSVTRLGMATPPDISEEDIRNSTKTAKAAGKFLKKLESSSWQPSLGQVVQFYAQKTFLTTPWAKEISPKDYEYYLPLKDSDYHTNVKLNPFKKLVGKLVALAVKARS